MISTNHHSVVDISLGGIDSREKRILIKFLFKYKF